MPSKTMPAIGNELFDSVVYSAGVTFPTLSANASATNTLTVTGVQQYDCLSWNLIAPPAHLQIDNMYVSSANTITILWGTDGTGITGAATANILIEICRPDGGNLGTQALPTSFT